MKMKKFLAMLLALSLVLSLAAPMAAAEGAEETSDTETTETGDREETPDTGDQEETPGTPDPDPDPDKSDSEDPEDPGKDPENPSTDPEDPGKDPEDPGKDPEDPSTDPEDPGKDPEDPGKDPEDPGKDPEDPGKDPENPSTDPEDPGKDPENPSTDPEDPGKDPEDPGKDPENPSPEDPDKKDPEVPAEPNVPGTNPDPLSPEEQEKLDQLGGAADAIGDETGKDALEAIKNDPLFDRLSDEQKAAVLAKLEAIQKAEEEEAAKKKQEDLAALGGKVDGLTGEVTRDELLTIKNDPLFKELTAEQQQAVLDRLAALEELLPPVTGGALYDRLMAAGTLEEFNRILFDASQEELEELSQLPQEQKDALEAHRQALMRDVEPFIPPVSFTDVAPLVKTEQPAKAPKRSRAMFGISPLAIGADSDNPVQGNNEDANMVTRKTLSPDGSTITIEAYAKGTYTPPTTVTKSSPTDIVLVLDQSSSMQRCMGCNAVVEGISDYMYDTFGISRDYKYMHSMNTQGWQHNCKLIDMVNVDTPYGYSMELGLSKESTVRQDIFVEAVQTFLTDLAAVPDGDFRIAVVSYESFIDTNTGFQRLTSDNVSSFYPRTFTKDEAGYYDLKGATDTGSALETAVSKFENGYDGTDRKQALVFFTDGFPNQEESSATQMEERIDVTNANRALSAIRTLKNDYPGVTVYSIGIYGQANVGQYNDFSTEYSKANHFMNAISSDCSKNPTNLTDTIELDKIELDKDGKELRRFLTAANHDELVGIFRDIAENIGGGSSSNVTLNANTVIKDAITPYFQTNKGGITAKVMQVNGKVETEASTISSDNIWLEDSVNENGDPIKVVNVKGFDFSKNFLVTKDGKQEGQKLVITIPIERKPDFWGGNGVPTNVPSQSGVYGDLDSDETAETCVKALHTDGGTGIDSPKTNVSLLTFQVDPVDHNVYYGGEVPGASEMYDEEHLTVIQENGTMLTFIRNGDGWMREDTHGTWQDDYAELSGTASLDKTVDNTQDGSYQVTGLQVVPKTGIGSADVAFADGESADVAVWTPTLTFHDLHTYLMQVPSDEQYKGAKEGDAAWAYTGDLEIGKISTDMYGTEVKEIEFTCTVPAGTDASDDYAVSVTVTKIGGATNVPNDVCRIAHKNCGDAQTEDLKGGDFLVHVYKPVVTFKDSTVYRGESFSKYNFTDHCVGSIVWKNGDTNADSVTMVSGKPALTLKYVAQKGVTDDCFDSETTVRVTEAKIDGKDVSNHVKYDWTTGGKGCTCTAKPTGDDHFTIHVKTCDLTVKKEINLNGKNNYNPNKDTFVFTVTGDQTEANNALAKKVNVTVVITGPNSQKISGLPIGSYTVTEESGWAWRYTCGSGTAALTATESGDSGTVIITNTLDNDKWLSYEEAKVNNFGLLPASEVPGLGDADVPKEPEFEKEETIRDESDDGDDPVE